MFSKEISLAFNCHCKLVFENIFENYIYSVIGSGGAPRTVRAPLTTKAKTTTTKPDGEAPGSPSKSTTTTTKPSSKPGRYLKYLAIDFVRWFLKREICLITF